MGSYRVDASATVRAEIRRLPGHVRQRVIGLLRELEEEPRPSTSRSLDPVKAGVELPAQTEVRRVRLADWRVVYLIEDDRHVVTVLAIRRRPPYQYDDLAELVGDP